MKQITRKKSRGKRRNTLKGGLLPSNILATNEYIKLTIKKIRDRLASFSKSIRDAAVDLFTSIIDILPKTSSNVNSAAIIALKNYDPEWSIGSTP